MLIARDPGPSRKVVSTLQVSRFMARQVHDGNPWQRGRREHSRTGNPRSLLVQVPLVKLSRGKRWDQSELGGRCGQLRPQTRPDLRHREMIWMLMARPWGPVSISPGTIYGLGRWIVFCAGSLGPCDGVGRFELDEHAASTPQSATMPEKASRPRICSAYPLAPPRNSTISSIFQARSRRLIGNSNLPPGVASIG